MSAELYDGKGSVSILSNRGLVVADMAEIDNSGKDITAIITITDNIAAQTNSQNCALAARILSERASTLQRGLGRFKVRASKVCGFRLGAWLFNLFKACPQRNNPLEAKMTS